MNQPLNAAQIQLAQRYATEMVLGVQLRKWAVETALKFPARDLVGLAEQIYKFVTTEISEVPPAHTPQEVVPSAEELAARQRHIAERAVQ